MAEEALILVGIGFAALVDADAADGVVRAVEGAAEVAVVRAVVASDGLVVAFGAIGIVPRSGVVVGDVLGQHEILASVVVAAVHVGGQLVEVCGARNLVGGGFGAAATAESTVCPRRLCGHGEHHCEQQHRRPPDSCAPAAASLQDWGA